MNVNEIKKEKLKDFKDFHRFGYMFSVFICGISGKYLSPTDFTDFHGFVFLVAANALGIGAASFWSVAEKDIAESPTAIAGTPRKKSTDNSQQSTDFVHDNLIVSFEIES